MAYMPKEKKAKIAAALKTIVPAGWKYSLAVRHHSTIVMTISAAPIDLPAEIHATRTSRHNHNEPAVARTHYQVNDGAPERDFGASLPVFQAICAALNLDNKDNSDAMTDYFDVGHYVSLNIGRWDKPFTCTGPAKAE